MTAPRAQHRTCGKGFTLLEIMVTMMVFVFLSAMVFEIITSILRSASTLQDNQNQRDEISALHYFLKSELGGLPANSFVNSYRRGDGEGLAQNGIMYGNDNTVTAIDAKLQPNGYYTLRYAQRFQETPLPNQVSLHAFFGNLIQHDDPTIDWLILINDVQTLGWKFQDINSLQWFDFWNNTTAKPNLIELNLQMAGANQPTTIDLWIPPIFNPNNQIPVDHAP